MSVVIGFDGGGTGTAVLVEESQSGIRHHYQVGPTNRHSVGDVQVEERLKDVFLHLNKIGFSIEQVEGICFGGAGVDTKEDEIALESIFQNLGYTGALKVVNDAVTALVGANAAYKGAVLISGTGSIALGVDQRDELVRVGGWGHLIDDTGSAYAIARDGIRSVLEGHDGRGDKTRIWDGIKSVLKLTSPEDLINYVYAPDRQKQDIAALAPIVTNLAKLDTVADTIIEKTVQDLADHIKTLSVQMGSESFTVGLIGSVLEKSDYIRLLLEKDISTHLPNVELHLPKLSPVEGALLLAKEI